MTAERTALIEQRLREAFAVEEVHIVDDSAAHAGHAGARSGGGHFNVTIIARDFAGKSLLARHRLVYASLRDLMPTEIHALSVKALTPEEL